MIKNFETNPFFIEYILVKKAKARLSGPPDTATIKSSFKSNDFSNFL